MTELGIEQGYQHQLSADHMADNDGPIVKPLVICHEPGDKRCGCGKDGQIISENSRESHFGRKCSEMTMTTMASISIVFSEMEGKLNPQERSSSTL